MVVYGCKYWQTESSRFLVYFDARFQNITKVFRSWLSGIFLVQDLELVFSSLNDRVALCFSASVIVADFLLQICKIYTTQQNVKYNK